MNRARPWNTRRGKPGQGATRVGNCPPAGGRPVT